MLMCTIWLVLVALAPLCEAVRVSSLMPETGSRAGGTYLTIRGAGFMLEESGDGGILRVRSVLFSVLVINFLMLQ